jgi:citrate lyase subunit beta/citryl-CoA lyase
MNSIQAVAPHPLALVNTFLFVPATRPERFAKALLSGAGGVIIDLEDAVAAADKLAARSALMAGVAALPAEQRGRVLVRINAVGTAWHADDVAAAAGLVALGRCGCDVAQG